jgi:non-ribosomal peptide synthetase component F
LTLNTIVQGAWGIVLGWLLDRTDVVFGVTVAGRPTDIDGIETIVGLFINAVPLRLSWRREEKLSEMLKRLQSGQLRLIEYQHLGLTEIQRQVGLGPLFDTLLVFENYPLDVWMFMRRMISAVGSS